MKFLKVSSPHFNERLLPIDSIVLHYTDMETADEALTWFLNPLSKVSSHYLIEGGGKIYQIVEEDKRAWHAGESYWQGCRDINSCSIGIELANPGHSHGYLPFPEAQIESLLRLCEGIRSRWDIPTSRILGHSDVAPQRKQDPGHLFPWGTLAREGLGLWPTAAPHHCEKSVFDINEDLEKIGYEVVSPPHALLAFQRHFQPHKVDGVPDHETRSLIQGLLKTQENLI